MVLGGFQNHSVYLANKEDHPREKINLDLDMENASVIFIHGVIFMFRYVCCNDPHQIIQVCNTFDQV